MQTTSRSRVLIASIALAILTLLTLGSIATVIPPAPQTDTAATGEFVAGRAFKDVQAIASAVHVTGSAAATGVREHIIDTLTGLGLSPQVHEGIGATSSLGGPAMALVRNVVAEIPGTQPTGRLILMAHYDSVQVSYGANDDGSGVATLLEVARSLATDDRAKNDVILLFTDAEEACLCGAESFVHSDPLAADGGVVLNFESRGANGPSVMFETAAGNSALISHYADAVPYPVATSMAVEVYRILPNDTDFTPFRESGRFTGLNSAYIDGVPVYHSPQDRPEYMDQGTLQQHGDNALALARQLGNADLGPLSIPAAHDATYFPVLGLLVQYPGTWVWPIAILALLAVLTFALLARRGGLARWGRMAGGVALMLVPLIGAAALAQLFWSLLVWIRPGYAALIDPWQPIWFRYAVCALAVFAVLGWYALWRERMGATALQVGALTWLAVLGVLTAAEIPGGSYLVALPALAGALAALGGLLTRPGLASAALATVAGAVGIVILVPTVLLFFPALGLQTGAAPAILVALLAFVLLPLLELLHPPAPADAADAASSRAPSRWWGAAPTIVVGVLAIALTTTGLVADGFDQRHPKPSQLMYALDADTGAAQWVTEQDAADGWLATYVGEWRDLSAEFPLLDGPLLAGPARAAALTAPEAVIESTEMGTDSRTVTLTLHPRGDARLVHLSSPDVTVRAATVLADGQSREMTLPEHGFTLLFHGPPTDGVRLRLTIDGTAPATFRLSDGSDGLDALPGFVPRPADIGVKGSHTSELLLVSRAVTF